MPINGKPTYYEFFGLENFESDLKKIKSAYRGMALKWHPDRNSNKDDAERMMKQVNEIWHVFSNSKESYDRYLRNKLNSKISEDPAVKFSFKYGKSPLEDIYSFDFADAFASAQAESKSASSRRTSYFYEHLYKVQRRNDFINSLTDDEFEFVEYLIQNRRAGR